MRVFESIILLIFPEDHENYREKMIINSILLAEYFGVELLIGARRSAITNIEDILIKQIYQKKVDVSVVPICGKFNHQAISLVEERPGSMILIQLNESETDAGFESYQYFISNEQKEFLEEVCYPTLILPEGIDLDVPPFSSMIVPMSGEKHSNIALGLGVILCNILNLKMDILHITEIESSRWRGESILEFYGDQFHHEYSNRIYEFIVSAVPFVTSQELHCIREFCHYHGDVVSGIRHSMRRKSDRLILFEWNGTFKGGHARILKETVSEGRCAVLLVKTAHEGFSTLKVGKKFRAA